MTPLWQLLAGRPAKGLRLRVDHPGGPSVDPGTYEGVVEFADRHPSKELDALDLRLDSGRVIHVPGGTRGEVVVGWVDDAALDCADSARRVEGVLS